MNTIDCPSHEFYKLYFTIETKTITPSDTQDKDI